MMNDAEELSYIAGFLDGEGCFFISGNRKAAIACENTYRPVIFRLKRIFGGSVSKIKGKKKNHRSTYRWQVVCKDAVHAASLLSPLLIEKAEQALILIGFQQTMGPVGIKVEKKVLKQRMWFINRIKKLKGRL